MKKNFNLRETVNDLSVLIPVYGLWKVDGQMRRGENPLIFQDMHEDGKMD
jgi:hypothetical protein